MKLNKRLLIKTGTGALAGFITGGWYGATASIPALKTYHYVHYRNGDVKEGKVEKG